MAINKNYVHELVVDGLGIEGYDLGYDKSDLVHVVPRLGNVIGKVGSDVSDLGNAVGKQEIVETNLGCAVSDVTHE